ncbi:unnamed protein product [Rotaria sp. Silwood1]|nr:unnamed protein product [Rotaria sp. Silwood1]
MIRAIQLIVDQSVNIVQDVKYRLKQHVDSQFNLIVPTEQIHFGCGYISFIGERFKTGNPSLDSISIIGCNINSSDNNTGCYITPIRNAMCAFNPQHAQGMTHALRHASELGKMFDEQCHKLEDISYIFSQRVSAIMEECWLASTISDWKTPTLKIIKN